jgi:predicted RNase H-like nuclease
MKTKAHSVFPHCCTFVSNECLRNIKPKKARDSHAKLFVVEIGRDMENLWLRLQVFERKMREKSEVGGNRKVKMFEGNR